MGPRDETRIRGRAEPRRADVRHRTPGGLARLQQSAQRPPLRRAAARCTFGYRRNSFSGAVKLMGAIAEPPKKVNRIGLEVATYRGSKTTLCAGCGHNAITERIVEAFYDMGINPSQVAKLSGIG